MSGGFAWIGFVAAGNDCVVAESEVAVGIAAAAVVAVKEAVE